MKSCWRRKDNDKDTTHTPDCIWSLNKGFVSFLHVRSVWGSLRLEERRRSVCEHQDTHILFSYASICSAVLVDSSGPHCLSTSLNKSQCVQKLTVLRFLVLQPDSVFCSLSPPSWNPSPPPFLLFPRARADDRMWWRRIRGKNNSLHFKGGTTVRGL